MSNRRCYKAEIDELRAIDRDESNEYVVQVALVGTGVFLTWALIGLWQVIVWYVLVYGLSTYERYLHRRSVQPYSKALYVKYIAIGTTIAAIASCLPVFLWTFNDRIYHFAALVYMVGAVLNTFVVRARAWPALLCYAIPNGLAMIAVAIMFILEDGLQASSFIGLVIAGMITLYMVMMVRESVRKVRRTRDTTKELLQAQKAETVANFAGGVAHDFNNLLGVIQASLEQAYSEKDERDRRALIDQALIAVERGAGLTRQLLAVGRQSDFTIQPIDVNAFAQELENFLMRIIPRSIIVTVQCDPKLKTIESEPSLLQSMLLNLAMNARDAMSDAGALKISIDMIDVTSQKTMTSGILSPGPYARFSVEDEGDGIPSEVFGRVLEPFFSTRPIGEGTGLGLAMVAGFSQQVDGALDITSREGQGTTVRFYLPLMEGWDQPPSNAAPLPQTRNRPKGSSRTVLLVEDEPALKQMLERYLTKKGFDVLACDDGDTALARIRDGYYADIVLTDVVMPGQIQGTDLIDRIRHLLPDSTFILMSGYSFSHDLSTFTRASESKLFSVAKPFKLSDLDRFFDGPAPVQSLEPEQH